MTVTPASQSVSPGANTSYSATVAAQNGFSGTVNLSVSGLPSGATGTFTPASINTSGSSSLAISTTASTAAGTYPLTVTATSGTLSHTAPVTLIVNSSSSSGALSGALSTPSGTQNLTQLGTVDWAQWGLTAATSFNHKASGQGQISNYTTVGSAAATRFADHPFGFTWTDGTPTATGTNRKTGVYVAGINNGFQITAPADLTTRTLSVYVSVWTAQGKLVAHLSDGSAVDSVNTSLSNNADDAVGLYTLTYHAASSGQKLVVTFTQANSLGGNVALEAAVLR